MQFINSTVFPQLLVTLRPTPEGRASPYNVFEIPRSKAATDLGHDHAFYGPHLRSELRMVSSQAKNVTG
jgi:hypothetical protein